MNKPLRVLVVEDTSEDAVLLLRELKKGGFDVTHDQVFAPEDMAAALDGNDYDIVISDWSMPRFDGLRAYRLMRERGLDLPFIIVSGTIGEEIAVEALRAGVHDFMAKGALARLVPAIERELRDANVRRRQREAEIELEAQRAEIERSERLLRLVLDNVPDGVVVADRDGRVILSNPAAELVVQTTYRAHAAPDDTVGVFMPDRVTPFPHQALALNQALAGQPVDGQEQFVRHSPAEDGMWLSVNARPLRIGDAIDGAVAVFRDVTKEKLTQEQLMISDRMASIGMLAAGVGHEINNPLAAVLGNLELAHCELSNGAAAPNLAPIQEMIDDARGAADRVRMIVRDLRIFSRTEEVSSTAVDVQRVLESTLRMAWNEIRHRARVVKEYREVPLAAGTESRLGQVFLNLIVNAAQAIPEGNVDVNTIRVTTSLDAAGRVVVEIADTGAGMSSETLRHLFTPFYTTKPAGVGTGLGLAICQRIVTSLGGEIRVESSPGRGTTFRVALPCATEAQMCTEAHPLSESRPPRRGRVLVVDDEAMITAVIRRTLAEDHDTVTTTHAQEAIARIRHGEEFDVILCDLMMPHITGMELHAEIKRLRPEYAERIVFLTGGAFTPAARAFLDRVANARLEKPFNAQHLRACVAARIR